MLSDYTEEVVLLGGFWEQTNNYVCKSDDGKFVVDTAALVVVTQHPSSQWLGTMGNRMLLLLFCGVLETLEVGECVLLEG